jgi:peptidoglycan DL-endopeptidase CwlO
MPLTTAPPEVTLPGRPSGHSARRLVAFTTALLMSLVGVGAWSGVAAAEDGGGTATLRQQLDEATRGYLDATTKLEASKVRQQELTAQLAEVEGRFATESVAVAEIAAASYRSAGLNSMAGIVATGSPEGFLERVTLLNAVASHENSLVNRLASTRDEVNAAKAAIDGEVGLQQEQLAAMEQRKQQAERALWAVGGGAATGGFSASSSIIAEPAPRNADGSLPGESCSVYESVTGGCITPRTAHARDQAQAAGFGRHVTCYRSVWDGGEHPKGRACDFAAAVNGFGGEAYGEEYNYGTNLTAFFVFNASRLGVQYLIWYRQIWLPGSGWRSYGGCCDPSSAHTNHVHISMY